MPWPWIFFGVTLVGAWFTFNAYLPHRPRTNLAVPSFLAGWLTSELFAHHFAWQLGATLFFVYMGALEAWPGWAGLGITLASWIGLFAMVPASRRTAPILEDALTEALGKDYRDTFVPRVAETFTVPETTHRLLLPFRFKDPRVLVDRNVRYAEGAGKRHLLDVYRRRGVARDAPVLLQIHGGAWTVGNKHEQALPLMMHLAARGWVCVATNYRLSPKATFPDHLLDVKLAIRWIREHVAEYGGDPEFLVLTGGSAGGHLCSLAALTANDPEYQPGFEELDTSVDACVPFYGVYDFANQFGLAGHEGMEKFLAKLVMKKRLAEDREAYEKASPAFRAHPDAPPFFIIHGTHDSLAPVEEARAFSEHLRKTSKTPVIYAELPGAQHAFEIFHSLRTRHVVRGVDRFLAWAHSRYLTERERT